MSVPSSAPPPPAGSSSAGSAPAGSASAGSASAGSLPAGAEALLHRLTWRVLRPLDGRLQGDYRTVFRGAGIDMADIREYLPGDDTRHIDWNVTARMGEPYVRRYTEDREVTAWLLLDRTASMGFGPTDRMKALVLAEIAGTLAQILARGGNRIGAVLFDHNQVQRVVPAGAGRVQVLRIVHELLPRPAEPERPRKRRLGRRRISETPATGTDLAVLLAAATGIARRRSTVVVVSDFISRPGWERPLALLAQRHDVVAIRVTDPREYELPAVGGLYVEDAETGEQIFVDTADPVFRRRLAEAAEQRDAELAATVRRAGTELFDVSTDEDLVPALARISELRKARAGRNAVPAGRTS